MALRNTGHRYGSVSIGFHWLMLVLIAAVYACIELRGSFPKGSDPRNLLKIWHFMLGLLVLGTVALRLIWNLTNTTPRITPEPPRWQTIAARLMHVALYGLMISLPIAGWLILSAEGKPVFFFGLELPALMAANRSLARLFKTLHETAGNIGLLLIGLHAAAALFHHHIKRDNTLTRIWPKRGNRR